MLGQPFIAYAPPPLVPAGVVTNLRPTVDGVARGTYVLNGPANPALSVDRNTGVLSVLPGATGTYPGLTVTVTDFDDAKATSSPFTIAVGGRYATLSIADGQTAVTNQEFSNAFTASGLAAPVSYTLMSGKMPPGLKFCANPDRICSVPTTPGTYSGLTFLGVGSDGLGAATQNPITITVAEPSLSYASSTVTVGKQFSISPTAKYLNGATYAFSGSPPAGVTVNPSTGVVSGSLSNSGPSAPLTVVATKSPTDVTTSNPFTLTGKLDAFAVNAPMTVVTAHVGYPVSQQLTSTASSSNMTWAVTKGALPDGLLLNATSGLVSGAGSTPAKVSDVVITANAGGVTSDSDPLSYNILPAPTVAANSVYPATSGQAFTAAFTAGNLIGAGSYTTDLSKLPPGLQLASNGTLTGNPTTVGTYDGIVVAVTDAYDGSTGKSKPFTIDVADGSGNLYAGGLPSLYRVRQDTALATQAPTVSGTTYPVTWARASDSAPLPTGLDLNPATGVIYGTPTSPGDTANIVLVATEVIPRKAGLDLPAGRIRLASNDASWTVVAQAAQQGTPGRSARTRSFTISVAPPLTVSNVQSTYAMKVASAVSVAPKAEGVMGSTTWTLTGGSLPNAVSFDPNTGRIAGPALAPGRVPGSSSQALKLTATDSFDGAKATSPDFALTVEPGLAVIGPTALGTRTGQAYDSGIQFNVSNAVSSLTWQVVGTLPDGFRVNPGTGAITGTSTVPTITNNLRMAATQLDGTTGVSAPFTFTVQGGLVITYPAYMIAHVNVPMPPVTPTITGAQGGVNWGAASGSLPPGVTLNPATGALSGTPTAGGFYYNIQIGAQDATGNNGVSQPITLYVNNGLEWGSLIQAPVSRNGSDFTSNQPRISGASGSVTYKLVNPLFDWQIDPNTGIITGHNTPYRYGSYIYPDWLVATDSTGASITHPMMTINYYGNLGWGCSPCGVTVGPNTVATAVGGDTSNIIGTATYSKVETAGPWPSWITLNPTTGTAYGMPPSAGTYTFTTMLTDSADGKTVQITRSITLDPNGQPNGNPTFQRPGNACAVGGQLLDTGPGSLVNFSPSSTVAWNDYFGSNLAQSKPAWMNFDPSSGRIYGQVPTDASGDWSNGYLSTNQTATDPTTNPVTSINQGGLFINTYGRFDVIPPPQTSTGYVVAQFYDGGDPNQKFRTPGGRDGLRMYVSDGRLPPGLNLSSSYYHDQYWIDGTPTTPGTYTFTITGSATQCNGSPVMTSKVITVTVSGTTNTYIQSQSTLYGRVGVPFRSPKPVVANLPAGSDPSQFKWGWGVQDSLPSGLGVDQGDGSIYGVPTQTWNDRYRYSASQCCYYGYIETKGLWGNLVITPGPTVQQSDVTLLVGVAASVAPKVSGFSGQVNWSGANLPPGLGVDPGTGVIVGTPSTVGTYPNVTVSGAEVALAASYQGDPKALYPGASSNAFTITVKAGPSISGVGDQKRTVGLPFSIVPQANSFGGAVTWSLLGYLPAGLSFDPATGAIGGSGTKYGASTVQVSATDASGLSATSVAFTLSVTDPDNVVPVDGTATWTWGQQVCTYNCSGSTCSGRQQQTCSGSACTVPSRGCDAPYSGGDTSYPVGMTATSCDNPTPYPSQGYCPTPTQGTGTPGGQWAYNPTVSSIPPFGNSAPVYQFVIHYVMTCLKINGLGGAACTTVPPSSISYCQVNKNGVGNCGSNVRFTDGTVQTRYEPNTAVINAQ